jgi:hypothetical protein
MHHLPCPRQTRPPTWPRWWGHLLQVKTGCGAGYRQGLIYRAAAELPGSHHLSCLEAQAPGVPGFAVCACTGAPSSRSISVTSDGSHAGWNGGRHTRGAKQPAPPTPCSRLTTTGPLVVAPGGNQQHMSSSASLPNAATSKRPSCAWKAVLNRQI